MKRPPLKVSGLLASGKIHHDPAVEPLEEFGAATGRIFENFSGPTKIALELIDDSQYQPRMVYDPLEIDNLAHSLAAAGLEDPVTVRLKESGRYELISGHRRTRAARSLGWVEIDANIVKKNDREAELATMVQNEARVDLTDYERGKLYQAAIAGNYAKTQTDVANLFGTTQGRVSRCMAMLKLPPVFISMLESRPGMFGHTCAESISQLLTEFPNEAALIEEAVLRINTVGADQKSVKQWVLQMVKAKNGTVSSPQRVVVTDRSGRELFTAKIVGQEVIVKLKSKDMDIAEIEAILLDALRKRALAED